MRELHRAPIEGTFTPRALAEILQDLPGAFWLDATRSGGRAIFGAFPTEHVVAWDPEPSLRTEPGPEHASWVPRWIGVLPYDACREIELAGGGGDQREHTNFEAVEWRRYGAVISVEGSRAEVLGDDPHAVLRLSAAIRRPRVPFRSEVSAFSATHPDEAHADSVRAILEEIASGAVYQVNLARAFRGATTGSAFSIYAARFGRAGVPFGFALEWTSGRRVVGASPELCLEYRADGTLLTRPIKGTRPRGQTREEDEGHARELARDPKEIAELSMVIDLERNDLSRLSRLGTVEVVSAGDIESFESVHHRVATVRSHLAPGVSREELLRSFLPSGSVTGTPKRAAMRLIARLEPQRRGLYTGAVGYLAQDGGLRLAMAIRTLVVDRDAQATYYSGGGIVADSVAEREVLETRWKAEQVLRSGVTASASWCDGQPSDGTPCVRPGGPKSAENWADWLGSSTTDGERTQRAGG